MIIWGNSTPQGTRFTALQKCFNLPINLKIMINIYIFFTISKEFNAYIFLEINYTQGSELPQLNQSGNQGKCHSLTFFHQNRLLNPKVLLSGYIIFATYIKSLQNR